MPSILVIEDSVFMGRLIASQLAKEGLGATVQEPPAPAEIEGLLDRVQPDLLLTDLRMPGCSGATVARMAKRLRAGMRVLMVTAVRGPEVDALLAAGTVDAVLYKPYAVPDLLAVVQGLLA